MVPEAQDFDRDTALVIPPVKKEDIRGINVYCMD
jgi:hypothetical protein